MLEDSRSKFLIAGTAVLALMTSGCGRTQSSLLPRVNVGQLMDDDSSKSGESAEQYANNQIDAELREKRSTVAEASKTILASAEDEGRSWKDRLLPKKSDLTAEDFGKDPFLEGLDGMIAEQDAKLQNAAKQASETLSDMEAAELFGEPVQRARDTLANLDRAATETAAKTEDVFGAAANDIFGPEPTATAPTAPTNEFERASQNGAGRQTVAQRLNGAVVHRFDDLFEEAESGVQRVANRTRESVQDVMTAARPSVPREPHQLNIQPVPTEIQVPQVPNVPMEAMDTMADMFESPDVTVPEPAVLAAAAPEMPELPDNPLASFEQQDAVVTPNMPAALPAPRQPELSDNDFAAMERVDVDPYEDSSFGAAPSFGDAPSFGEPEPELPAASNFPPVQIPQEPAPRFAAHEPTPPMHSNIHQVAQTRPVPAPVGITAPPQQAPAVAAVLPDVNWQGQTAAPRKLRAPSEWTAWFLMGGAALIVLLLFAPGRRE